MSSPFTVILVAMAFVAMIPSSLGQYQPFQPFQQNGVIIEGIDVAFAIKAAGEIWNAARAIDALAYPCNNVLPEITSAFPSTIPKTLWSPICDPITRGAAEAANSFNSKTVCETVFTAIETLIGPQGGPYGRKRRQSGDDPIRNIFQNIFNIVYDIYRINASDPRILSDPSILCANADLFLVPSLPEQISNFATELLSLFLSLGNTYVCTSWDRLISEPDRNGVVKSTEYNQLADAGAKAAGFTNRADLCEQLGTAVAATESDQKALARSTVESSFRVFTEASQCMSTSTEVIAIIKRLDTGVEAILTDANILKYTGYRNTDAVCDAMGSAFNTYSKAFEVTMSSTLLTLMATAALVLRA